MAASVKGQMVTYQSPGGQTRTMFSGHAKSAYQDPDNKKLYIECKNGSKEWTEVYEIPFASSAPKKISG